MGAQVIVTDKGEELIVLSRREYDGLLARLGDEEAKDRIDLRIIEEYEARLAAGDEPPPINGEIAFAMLDGAAPLRAIRLHHRRDLVELARLSGLSDEVVAALDDGSREPTDEERRRLAAALDVDPRWLDPL